MADLKALRAEAEKAVAGYEQRKSQKAVIKTMKKANVQPRPEPEPTRLVDESELLDPFPK
jgi:hypothetical protein